MTEPNVRSDDSLALPILEKVWPAYKRFSGWTLREKTHETDTPWSKVYRSGVSDTEIPDTLIASHFREKIRDILDAADR